MSKTTLALDIAEEREAIYLDLEARADREKLHNPILFLTQNEDKLIILDEIYRMPDIFRVLRGLIDQERRKGLPTGRFLIISP